MVHLVRIELTNNGLPREEIGVDRGKEEGEKMNVREERGEYRGRRGSKEEGEEKRKEK